MDSGRQDAAAESSSSSSTSQALVTTCGPPQRLLYNNGYGDFCFARLIERDPEDKNKSYSEMLVGSHNEPFQELDSFEREGPFPFFRLPLELRQRIYCLILEPFFCKSKYGRIQVTSKGFSKHLRCSYYQDFDSWLARKSSARKRRSRKVNARLKQRFFEEQQEEDARTHEYSPHPARTYPYQIESNPERKDSCGIDYPLAELIRNISNINCQMRQELGQAFWKDVEITLNTICFLETSSPEQNHFSHAILDERPAAHAGIKSLQVSITDIELEREYAVQSFLLLLRISSGLPSLEEFHLNILILSSQLPNLLAGKGIFAPLVATRSLKVSDFDLVLDVDSDANYISQDEVDADYLPVLKNLLLPDVLRLAAPITEMEDYLISRDDPSSETSLAQPNL